MNISLIESMRLETERLIIRRFNYSDKEGLFALFSDPDTCKDDGGYRPYERDDRFNQATERFCNEVNRYAVVLKETGETIGIMTLKEAKRGVETLELAYIINKNFRRRGYAYECSSAVMDFCFNKVGVEMMIAAAFAFNIKSRNLLLKLGFTQEGITHKAIKHGIYGTADLVNYYKLK
ncbi:MAG TPA: GNAT family N-acetyltransferase [Eubacteriales bacterium]|nr:GNAT family N-acetyltransferase [Eubacteriales bacterium]